MNKLLQNIEHILKDEFPVILEDFNPPCSSEDMAFLRRVTYQKIGDLYAFYNLHDGQNSYDLAFSSPWRLLSVRHIKKNLQIMNEDLTLEWAEDGMSPDDEAESRGPVKPVLWNSRWIPIASNGGGDLLCLDLNPDATGRVGQIIVWWHETVLREVVYSSFREMMADYLRDLEARVYVLVDGKGLSKI